MPEVSEKKFPPFPSATALYHRKKSTVSGYEFLLCYLKKQNTMRVKLKGIGTILKKTFKDWNEDDPFRQSSIIAYYAIFSLPALLVLIINVAGFFFGKERIAEEISRQISDAMGDSTAEQVGSIVNKASEMEAGVISSIIAVITIIFGSTGVFVQLQANLNQIWDVKQKPSQGFLKMLKNRLFSFGLIVSIGFLLLMSLVISSMLAAFSHWIEAIYPDAVAYLFYALEFAVSLVVISVLFALMFKILPDVKIKWREVAVGSVLTGFLFILGKYGLSFYFGKAEPGSVYGAAGSVILILLWASYSSMIVFFGAEFTKQYAVYHGMKIEPTKDAEKIKASDGAATVEKTVNVSQTQTEKPEKEKGMYTMKNREEIKTEVQRLETRLESDKEHIKDNLKLTNIIIDLVSRMFSSKKRDKELNADLYLKGMAQKHVTFKSNKGWLDKVKTLLHLNRAHS